MIQTLKKYSFWIFLMPAALIILIELLGVADLPTLIEGLGFMLFITACTLVPDSFGKRKVVVGTHSDSLFLDTPANGFETDFVR